MLNQAEKPLTAIIILLALSSPIVADCFCGTEGAGTVLPSLSVLPHHQLSHISQALENTISHFNRLHLIDPRSKEPLVVSKAQNVDFQKFGPLFRFLSVHSLNQVVYFRITIESRSLESAHQYLLRFNELTEGFIAQGYVPNGLSHLIELETDKPGYELTVCRFLYAGMSALIKKYAATQIEQQFVEYGEDENKEKPTSCRELPTSFSDFLHKDSIAFELQQFISEQSEPHTPVQDVYFDDKQISPELDMELDYTSMQEDVDDINSQIEELEKQAERSQSSVLSKRDAEIRKIQEEFERGLVEKRETVQTALDLFAKPETRPNKIAMFHGLDEGLLNGQASLEELKKTHGQDVIEQNPFLLAIAKQLAGDASKQSQMPRDSNTERMSALSVFTYFGESSEDLTFSTEQNNQLLSIIKHVESETDAKPYKNKIGQNVFKKQLDIQHEAVLKIVTESEKESFRDLTSDIDEFDDIGTHISQAVKEADKNFDTNGKLLFARAGEADLESHYTESVIESNPFPGNMLFKTQPTKATQINDIDQQIAEHFLSLEGDTNKLNEEFGDLTANCDKLHHRKPLFIFDQIRHNKQKKKLRLKKATLLSRLYKPRPLNPLRDLKLKVVYDSQIETEALQRSSQGQHLLKSTGFFSEGVALSDKKRQEVEDWIISLAEILEGQGLGGLKAPRIIIYSDYSIFIKFPGLNASDSSNLVRKFLEREIEREVEVDVKVEGNTELHFLKFQGGQILLRHIDHSIEGQAEIERTIEQILQNDGK